METVAKTEKNHGRYEKRTAYVTSDNDWIYQKEEWKNFCCIGVIHNNLKVKKENQANGIIYIKQKIVCTGTALSCKNGMDC